MKNDKIQWINSQILDLLKYHSKVNVEDKLKNQPQKEA